MLQIIGQAKLLMLVIVFPLADRDAACNVSTVFADYILAMIDSLRLAIMNNNKNQMLYILV
jgi:hypothetical protein